MPNLPQGYPRSALALRGRTISTTAPASGEVLTYNGSEWAPAAAAGGGANPPWMTYDSFSSPTKAESAPMWLSYESGTFGGGFAFFLYIRPQADMTIGRLSILTGSTATSANSRLGLYTVSEATGDVTLVARTALTTIFGLNNQYRKIALDTGGGYPATYSITSGTRYVVAMFCAANYTFHKVMGRVSFPGLGGNRYLTGLSDLPASALGTAFTSDPTIPWLAAEV